MDGPRLRLSPGEAAPYDLTSQSQVSRAPLPALDVVDDRYSRLLRTALTGSLRRRVDAAPGGLSFAKFDEITASLRAPSCLALFRIEPLRSVGVMLLDAT